MGKKKSGTAPEAGKSGGKKKSGGTYLVVVSTLVFVSLAAFAAPALMILAVGMIPSLVAAIVDREPGRNATIAVTATNFAGVMSQIAILFDRGATLTNASMMVADVFSLAVMYGTAAFGWALVLLMPKVATVYVSVRNDARIQTMVREKSRLVEDWGDGVTEKPAAARPKSAN